MLYTASNWDMILNIFAVENLRKMVLKIVMDEINM